MRIVIGGAGEVGRHLAGMLSQQSHDVVLIDERQDPLVQAEEGLDVQVLSGDLASRRVLARAGAGGADAFIAVTGSDDANVLGAALARSMGAGVAVARVDQPSFYEGDGPAEHGLLGIDHLLCSTRLTAAELLTLMASADTAHVRGFCAGSVQVALWTVAEGHPARGNAPQDLSLPRRVVVGGVARDGFLRPPEGAPRLEPGDTLLLAGPPDGIAEAFVRIGGLARGRRHVVVGGGEIGAILADTLSRRGQRAEVVEPDRRRCDALAADLPKVSVLRGDPTDLSFLRDIRFHEADSVVAVTQHEEVNLLTTLLVRQLDREAHLAVPHTYVSVHRHGYADLCRRIGIEGTASSFEVLSRAILEAIEPPGVVARHDLPGLAWIVAHLRTAPALREATLADVALPPGATALAVSRREQVLTPRPSLALQGSDEIIVVCPPRDLAAVERALRDLARRDR
ncbi:MAG: Trk system potassium transporter TrkA [Myxococcota bacterium]